MDKKNIVPIEIMLIVLAFVGIALLVSIVLARNQSQPESWSSESDSFNIVSTDSPVTEHTCRYTVTLVAPTCTNDGYKSYICECGISYTEKYADKIDHIYSEKAKVEATCTNEGYIDYLCMCGDTYKRTLDKLGHSYVEEDIAPTCISEGYKKYLCQCGNTYTKVTAEMIPHAYNAVSQADATCTTEGYVEYLCACGDSYTEKLSMLDHIYKEEETPATCNAEGYKKYTCDCGYTYTDIISEKLGHVYYETAKTEATCTMEGVVDYTCVCGDTYKEIIAKTGHYYNEITTPATCTQSGKNTYTCKCGDAYTVTIKAKGHSYTTNVTHPTCTIGGYTTYTCYCGYKYKDNYTAATGHKWSKWVTSEEATTRHSGKQYRKCTSCSISESNVIDKKKAVNLNSITPVSMFDGLSPEALKAVNAVLKCVDDYYETNNNNEIYLGIFELTWIDVSAVESSIAFYLGSYYDGLKSTIFYYIDENHQHLFVDMFVMRKAETARREMMNTIRDELSWFEAGDNEHLVKQVFDYLANNISYNGNQSDATVALSSGKGSCNTYPVLFKLMLCQLGIKSDICIGYAYTGVYHAWNRIQTNGGEYKYYDLTFYKSTNNSNKYYASSSLKHEIVAVNRYLTSNEQQGK